jgi:hypothetical protein
VNVHAAAFPKFRAGVFADLRGAEEPNLDLSQANINFVHHGNKEQYY